MFGMVMMVKRLAHPFKCWFRAKRNICVFAVILMGLSGCAAQKPLAPTETERVTWLAEDAQDCTIRSECTLKVSRTLLFVFDYAEAGGALVERKGSHLFTPPEATPTAWPALSIRLAEPVNGHFHFDSRCQLPICLYSPAQLLRVYRSYLVGQPCSLLDRNAILQCSDATASAESTFGDDNAE